MFINEYSTKNKGPREESVGLAIFKFVPLFVFILLVIFLQLDLLVAAPSPSSAPLW